MKLKIIREKLQNKKDKSNDRDEKERLGFVLTALFYIEGNNPEIDNDYLRNVLSSHGLDAEEIMKGKP